MGRRLAIALLPLAFFVGSVSASHAGFFGPSDTPVTVAHVKVQVGDTFAKIARRLAPGATDTQITTLANSLKTANNNPSKLTTGQILVYDIADLPIIAGAPTTTVHPTTTTTAAPPTSVTATTAHQHTTTTAVATTAAPTTAAPTTAAPTTAAPTTAPSSTVAPSLPLGGFLETFSGSPTTPQPFISSLWDITINTRDAYEWYSLAPFNAQHGHDCAGPPNTHEVTTFDNAVFNCRDHVMTAFNASSEGDIYLTPNQMVDFTNGVATVKVDVSTARASTRDWWGIWLTPYDQNTQRPNEALPPLNGIYMVMRGNNGFKAIVYRNGVATELRGGDNWWRTYDDFLTPDAARRDTFELKISRTHISFGMPGYNFRWYDEDIAPLSWTQAVVQFEHASYNPTKDGGAPGTWHWDNVSIAPSLPFTIIKSDRRYVRGEEPNQPVTFAAPAPAASKLRFIGVSETPIQVSFDSGTTWTNATKQVNGGQEYAGHGVSYWTDIPPGTTSVRFRGDGEFWGRDWIVHDISIWTR